MIQRQDLNRAAQFTHLATYAYIALQLAYSVWLLWYNKVYSDYLDNTSGVTELARLNRMDASQLGVGIGFIVLTLAIYVINGRWIYLASSNAAQMVPSQTRIRPGWAVGWYFVPIASLWMPFKAMKETWAASVGGGRLEAQVPTWVNVWWAAWVILTISDSVGSNLGVSPTATPEQYINGNIFLAITGVLWTIPAVLFLRIVRSVTANQGGAAEVFA